MKLVKIIFLVLTVIVLANNTTIAQEKPATEVNKLMVLWTSDDPMVAERVALMYTGVAKQFGLFEEVSVIIWGPSAKLVAENKDVQAKLKEMMNNGVSLNACVTCANMYGVSDQLKALGINVDIMGAPLTNALKAPDTSVLTF
ncbi:DsrE family protein [uncultured Draconibacterium sp.]|uniref:DsrE family protein n=1 Tax=uncultured Draconibacterium sp. TaxID=1573823 RepID=UPI002AA7EAFF|nr:DsrE family protein [uncultured Draconibacterium sp.]